MRKRCGYVMIMIWILSIMLMPYSVSASGGMGQTDGRVSLNLRTQTGEAVSGIQISIYQVGTAAFEGYNLVYTLAETLAEGKDIPINGLTADQNRSSAAKLWKQIQALGQDSLPVWTEKTDKEGKIQLEQMPMGIYLAVQTAENNTYADITPFLFYLPESGEDGWAYDIALTPKVEKHPEQKPSTPDGSNGPYLPQTGMLQWPVPLLAGSGVLLFAVGWGVSRSRRRTP